MKNCIHPYFLLENETAKTLYQSVKNLPIFDYNAHQNIQTIVDDKPYQNIGQMLLQTDHYKWRAMDALGVDDRLVRGLASDKEKFFAYAKILPFLIGNPIYHWTHMQLHSIFGIEDVLNETTAESIWQKANAIIEQNALSPMKLLRLQNVHTLYTDALPWDSLSLFEQVKGGVVNIRPIFQATPFLDIESPSFKNNLSKIELSSGVHILSLDDMLDALKKRMQHFKAQGTTTFRVDLDDIPYEDVSYKKASKALSLALSGAMPSKKQVRHFKMAMLLELSSNAKKMGWVAQYRLGALQDVNSELLAKYGIASGADVIQDKSFARTLAALLDITLKQDALGKTILYTRNPQSYEIIGSIASAFSPSAHLQFGTAWWFGDTATGFERHLQKIASTGAIATFVGMVSDSRSILGYTRYEYFRRILCNLFGKWVEEGLYPCDMPTLTHILQNICYHNAQNFFEPK